jgi:hypothetical protein
MIILGRFLRWRRYRRYVAGLVRTDRKAGRMLDAERIEALKAEARRAVEATGRRN